MKFRSLTSGECAIYRNDIFKCYKDCSLILDSQHPLRLSDEWATEEFVRGFVEADDSEVLAIFDDSESFLYGLVIFDNIRFANKSCAEVHIVTDKAIWGRKIKNIYKDMIECNVFDTLYCQIPSIAVNSIAMCKRLGFKKTGYIPDALPYVNAKNETKMYDIQIYTYRRI